MLLVAGDMGCSKAIVFGTLLRSKAASCNSSIESVDAEYHNQPENHPRVLFPSLPRRPTSLSHLCFSPAEIGLCEVRRHLLGNPIRDEFDSCLLALSTNWSL